MKFCHMLLALCTVALLNGQALAAPSSEEPGLENAPCASERPCFDQNGRGPRPFMQGLSEEQRAKYRAIVKEYEPKLQEYADQLFVKKNELEALKHSVQPDVKAVGATAKEIVDLRNARRALMKTIHKRIEQELGIRLPERMHGDFFHRGPRGYHHGGPRGGYHGGYHGGYQNGPCAGQGPYRGQGAPCGGFDR